jgi:hypothetical protein
MSFKKYNRLLKRKATRQLVNNHFNETIEDKLERETEDEAFENYYNREDRKYDFIDNYLEKNKPLECNNCHQEECLLYTSLSKCNEVGKEVKTISNEKGIYYKIKEITQHNHFIALLNPNL